MKQLAVKNSEIFPQNISISPKIGLVLFQYKGIVWPITFYHSNLQNCKVEIFKIFKDLIKIKTFKYFKHNRKVQVLEKDKFFVDRIEPWSACEGLHLNAGYVGDSNG